MINQLAVVLENRKGRIGDCCKGLRDAGINLSSMSIADTTDFGILRLMTNDNDKAFEVLKRSGFMCAMVSLVAMRVPDRPGALADILIALDEAGVNIEYLYSFASDNGSAHIGFKTNDADKAASLLVKLGVEVL